MGVQYPQPRQPSDNTQDFRRIFLRRVHELVGLGYRRLRPADLQGEDEDDITATLVMAIEAVLDEPQSPEWVTFYTVDEQRPISRPGVKAKRRRKLDIRIASSELRPRTRFAFEAKRLGRNHTVDIYLGGDGLGRFLTGAYAREETQAGMLGYVQAEQPADWAEAIRKRLSDDPALYRVQQETDFDRVDLDCGLDHVYRSEHDRPTPDRPISIFHTLLSFN